MFSKCAKVCFNFVQISNLTFMSSNKTESVHQSVQEHNAGWILVHAVYSFMIKHYSCKSCHKYDNANGVLAGIMFIMFPILA